MNKGNTQSKNNNLEDFGSMQTNKIDIFLEKDNDEWHAV